MRLEHTHGLEVQASCRLNRPCLILKSTSGLVDTHRQASCFMELRAISHPFARLAAARLQDSGSHACIIYHTKELEVRGRASAKRFVIRHSPREQRLVIHQENSTSLVIHQENSLSFVAIPMQAFGSTRVHSSFVRPIRAGTQRVTFLVNVWCNHKPWGAEPLPKSICNGLSKALPLRCLKGKRKLQAIAQSLPGPYIAFAMMSLDL